MISVPNLRAIFKMYLDDKNFDTQDKWTLTNILYGGQTDLYDYHLVSYDFFFGMID